MEAEPHKLFEVHEYIPTLLLEAESITRGELFDTIPPGPVIVYEVTESHDIVNRSVGLGHNEEDVVPDPLRSHPSPAIPSMEP